jgi:hypothetical protein
MPSIFWYKMEISNHLTIKPLHLEGQHPSYPQDRRFVKPKSWSEHCSQDMALSMAEIEPWPTNPKLVTLLTATPGPAQYETFLTDNNGILDIRHVQRWLLQFET